MQYVLIKFNKDNPLLLLLACSTAQHAVVYILALSISCWVMIFSVDI